MKFIDERIEDYCREHTSPLPEVFTQLRDTTYAQARSPEMQVGLLEGRLLQMLVSISRARLVLEFGTFTGFSALAMAEALPENGRLITCDIDPVVTEIARRFWAQSPHGKKIELRLGPALETVRALTEAIDLVFIDADKANYLQYWEESVPKVRPGGLLVVDNVLWSGAVLAPQSKSDLAIAAFNKHARADARVQVLMLPVRDGVLIAQKPF